MASPAVLAELGSCRGDKDFQPVYDLVRETQTGLKCGFPMGKQHRKSESLRQVRVLPLLCANAINQLHLRYLFSNLVFEKEKHNFEDRGSLEN